MNDDAPNYFGIGAAALAILFIVYVASGYAS